MILHALKQTLLFLWCLPQNIAGLIVLAITKCQGAKSERYNNTLVTYWKSGCGLSLGRFIFISPKDDYSALRHEYGHYLDGNCLGPLFLLVIGIPSFCWAAFFDKYRRKYNISYYNFYTERRADRLGEVIRKF